MFMIVVVVRIIDFNLHTHPRMNAALKQVFAFRKTRELELASLQNSRSGHPKIPKATNTFWSGRLSCIQFIDKASTKLLDLREGVGFAALVDN